jgi:uncharacterized protein (DUF4415 family)
LDFAHAVDVLGELRATGDAWQARIKDMLRAALALSNSCESRAA